MKMSGGSWDGSLVSGRDVKTDTGGTRRREVVSGETGREEVVRVVVEVEQVME